jgi:integrase
VLASSLRGSFGVRPDPEWKGSRLKATWPLAPTRTEGVPPRKGRASTPEALATRPGTAGLDDLRIHDLRHSFASIAVSGGDSLYLVGKVLGHRQSRTTERYAHLKDDPLRAVPGVMPGQDGKAGSLIELQS